MRTNTLSRKGFSLVEVVIAIGIVAVLLTTFMAVFGPAQQNINKALGVAEANRLMTTLETEMSTLRKGEESVYVSNGNPSAFEKAFQWIKNSSKESSAIVVYQYHAHPKRSNADETLTAVDIDLLTDKKMLPGTDYITQTIARRLDKSKNELSAELAPAVVQGNVYVVRMTQLVTPPQQDALRLGKPGEIVNPDGSQVSDSSALEDAVITVRAEFFQLPNSLESYVTGGTWRFDKLGAPVAVQNLAVRR